VINFRLMRQNHLATVLSWRTQEDITRCLFTDLDQPELKKQERWFAKVSSDPTCKYWVICDSDKPFGVLFMTGLDPVNRRASYGFYIGLPKYRRLAGMIPPIFYNHAFAAEGLALNKLVFEVFAWNEPVLNLHRAHGAREVGGLRDHILKNLKWHDVILFEMRAADWKSKSEWSRARAEFET
jgi:RimJ/RimL family protein N-acetyltransferase